MVAERLPAMYGAINRAQARVQEVLGGSTGAGVFQVVWDQLPGNAVAGSLVSEFHVASAAQARLKLMARAEADNEPNQELLMYEALPQTTVPFYYDTTAVRSAGAVSITNCLNKHLEFGPTTQATDGTLTFKPPAAGIKWQFFKGPVREGHQIFEEVLTHETLHVLGFRSQADLPGGPPSALSTWDLFRAPESSVPLTFNGFSSIVRELRPTVLAAGVTQLNSASAAYPLSSGTREGGDGFQASHWRNRDLLTPPQVIGIMDPIAYGGASSSPTGKYIAKSDAAALDIMGWNVNLGALSFADKTVELTGPAPFATAIAGTPITFEWFITVANRKPLTDPDRYNVTIFRGAEVIDDAPYRVYDDLTDTSFTIPCDATPTHGSCDALPPGHYVWYVVNSNITADFSSEDRHLIVRAACPVEYNGDGVLNPDDIGDFITDYFTDPPLPGIGGYAIRCPRLDPPYDEGYKAAYTSNGYGQCNPPFSDNVGDYITDYFAGC